MTETAPRPWLLLAGALVVVLGTYFRVVDGPFLWDDRPLILDDTSVKTFASPSQLLLSPFWSESPDGRSTRAFYRPLTTFSYAVDYRVHGANATGFHLTNVALHLLNVALLFALARRSGASGPIAGLLAAGWGTLPRLAESAAWISGRTDVLATTMTFAALLAWRRGSFARCVLAAVFLFLGMLAKEVAAAGFIAILVSEYVDARRREEREAHEPSARFPLMAFAPLAVAAGIYAVLRHRALSTGLPPPPYGVSPGSRIGLPFEAIGRYAWMLVDAFRPRTQIGFVVERSPFFVVLGVAVLVVLLVALWRVRGTVSAVGAGYLALGLVALALVVHLVRVPIDVVAADRYLYVPTAAFALAAVGPLERLATRKYFGLVASGLLAVSVVCGYQRVLDWSDEVRFWVDATATTPPENDLPRNELGNVFYRNGLYEKAKHHYELALAANSLVERAVSMRGNISNCLQKLGRYDDALAVRAGLLDEIPNVARLHFDLAVTSLSVLHFDDARRELRAAIDLFPKYDAARDVLGKVDDYEARTKKLIVDAVPNRERERDHASVVDLAHLFTQLGRYQDAIAAWRAVIAAPNVTPDEAREAAVYLVREADPQTAHDTVERLETVSPEEASPVRLLLDARLDTIERLNRLATD